MIKLLGLDYDGRLRASCATATCTVEWYLAAVVGAEKNLKIQRDIISGSKAYATLRADLKRGCLLPPLVLAAKNLRLEEDLLQKLNNGSIDSIGPTEQSSIAEKITALAPGDIYIIDGLQRTNAIAQTLDELNPPEKDAFRSRQLRLELWLEIPFGAIAYRMLVLNAGQKPMSIKHQIEVLSMKLEEELKGIPDIDIFTSLAGRRRTRPGQFQLAKLAQAFQAWLQGQPNLDLRNTVMEQMLAETAIETLGRSIEANTGPESDGFRKLVSWIVEIDNKLAPEQIEFFGNETVLLGLSAAVGAAERNPVLHERSWRALESLRTAYNESPGTDHIGVKVFDELRKGVDPSRSNVGQATRNMVYKAFQEFFLSDGLKPTDECWRFGAGQG